MILAILYLAAAVHREPNEKPENMHPGPEYLEGPSKYSRLYLP